MRLTDREFKAMNSGFRRFFQRRFELPMFRRLGLNVENQDVLEIGCGSGYGAVLLARFKPKSYVGVDLMPEMIDVAKQRPDLGNAEFLVMDATDLSHFPDASKDTVVIFGILHHIPPWRQVIAECFRVLRPGGSMFLEEPHGAAVGLWDAVFHWDHPQEGRFGWKEFDEHLRQIGFTVRRRFGIGLWRHYRVEKR